MICVGIGNGCINIGHCNKFANMIGAGEIMSYGTLHLLDPFMMWNVMRKIPGLPTDFDWPCRHSEALMMESTRDELRFIVS